MSAAPDPIETLLKRLPEKDRYIAQNSIVIAQRFGWTGIRFEFDDPPFSRQFPNEPPRLGELVANDGHGTKRFLDELDQ